MNAAALFLQCDRAAYCAGPVVWAAFYANIRAGMDPITALKAVDR